jgi:hypothetical protein
VQADASAFVTVVGPEGQAQLALAEKRHITSEAVRGSPPPPIATGPKHCGSEVLPFSQAIAFATAWLQLQSEAQAASWLEHPRAMQFQQASNAGDGAQEARGQPASPGVPVIGGAVPPDGPELPDDVALPVGPELAGGTELTGGWSVLSPEGAGDAEPEPLAATAPPSPKSSSPVRPPQPNTKAIAASRNSHRADFTLIRIPRGLLAVD